MSFDNAYEAITADNDSRWAFGTGFSDPLSGVDKAVPEGVDADELKAYCLMLGDDALIFSHRVQQWCTYAPELEDEVALANIALDLLGQARLLLSRPGDRSEDAYAFFREEREYRNVRLAELPRGDFAELISRLLVFSTWRLAVASRLTESRDEVLAAVAGKAVKELAYHRDYAAQWTVRLGDGTDYSRQRMAAGLHAVWPYVPELFSPHEIELSLAGAGVAVDPRSVREEFDDVVATVLTEATLEVPDVAAVPGVAGRAGRGGVHSEAMGYLLAELQSVARADPEATW
ncbi:phenylacetate-CoA oxygenase, PaaI subunit [Saccharomonospora marina XMU15]|uniref:Phenylacetate-CoA oxygenase, PaaI subunit n=1 Tax=Saccharomonospora marina XMU15 TaxID=882083 RepID=H5X031_9PSEU|nr:1,2-phenylacetyl-CoA epoxidase subunit PaaC [Saccharomonospora marina]EHR53027.1 phenylacetate-CoA oxygenase, PaaI subunit [Saccharomonospora marina XMU15]